MRVQLNDPTLEHFGIEYNISVKAERLIVKYNEDIMVRAKAFSNLQVDQDIADDAMNAVEDLRENTQNQLQSIIYGKKNRYFIKV